MKFRNEKHIASEEEISSVISAIRQSSLSEMIISWNEISETWAIDSVSQVHKSLLSSGHIHQIVNYILENSEAGERAAVS